MQLDLYLKETQQLTEHNATLLNEVSQRLKNKEELSPLEQNGVLHALQTLIENAIGKGKHILKHQQKSIPVSAYDVFRKLSRQNIISTEELDQWIAVIGLRNKIVHDYMNIDPKIILKLVKDKEYQMVVDFLLHPLESDTT